MPSSGTRVPGKSREPPSTEHGGGRVQGGRRALTTGVSAATAALLSGTLVGVVVLLLFSRCCRRRAASCSSWKASGGRLRMRGLGRALLHGSRCATSTGGETEARRSPRVQPPSPRHPLGRPCGPWGRGAARPSFPSRGRRALPHRHTERGLCPRADAAAGLGSRQHPGGPAAAGLWAQVPGYGGEDTGPQVAGAGRLTGLSCTWICLSLQKERKALGQTYGTNGQRPRGRSGEGVSTGRNAGTRRPARSGPRLAPRCGGGRSALGWRPTPGQHEGHSPPFSTNARVTKAHFRDPLNPLPKRA